MKIPLSLSFEERASKVMVIVSISEKILLEIIKRSCTGRYWGFLVDFILKIAGERDSACSEV